MQSVCLSKRIVLILLLWGAFFRGHSQDLNPKDWSHLKGYWKFQNPKDLTSPTKGPRLQLTGTHQWVQGASYGDTAIRIGIGSYYRCSHGIGPNGGGDSVNRYTLMFDFKVLNFNRWHTFFQTDTSNKNDGECFIRPNTSTDPGRIGTATTQYTPNPINPNQWYRLVISVNLNNFYRYYLNGQLVLEGDTQQVDGRFALLPQILFFADNNQEDDTIDIASLAIFDTCLTSKDIARIGTIEPCIANPPRVNLGADTLLCSGNSLNLNAGLNFVKYQWSTGDKLPFITVDASILGAGKKSVWVKVTDRNGCTGGDTIQINVLPAPAVNLGKDTTLCFGKSLKLTAGTDPGNKYMWVKYPQKSILSTSNSLTIDSSGKYYVIVTSAAGCTSTDTINISFYVRLSKPVINASGKTSFCDGDSVVLSGPGGYTGYLWSDLSDKQSRVQKKNAILWLKVRDKNGCESPSSDSLRVEVFQNPPAPQISITGDTLLCEGDSVVLAGPKGQKQYLWRNGATGQTVVIRNTDWEYLIIKDSNFCQSPVSKTITIQMNPAPLKPGITANGPLQFCEGGDVMLSGPSGAPGYLWSDGEKTGSRLVKQSATLRLKLISSEGCGGPWSDPKTIIVDPTPPKPMIAYDSVKNLKSGISAEQYEWRLNNKLLFSNTRSITPAVVSGYFQVRIANKGCWSAWSDSFLFMKNGLDRSENILRQLSIFPNPARDQIHIILPDGTGTQAIVVTILNGLGESILHYSTRPSDRISLGTAGLPSGVYYVKMECPSGVWTGRFYVL